MRALLGVQSYFSLHWGTASPADWFTLTKSFGYTHLGIADHAALYALPELAKHAETSGVAALYGASFPFADGCGVIAFVKSPLGYGNLCQRITVWHEECVKHPTASAGGVPALEATHARPLFRHIRFSACWSRKKDMTVHLVPTSLAEHSCSDLTFSAKNSWSRKPYVCLCMTRIFALTASMGPEVMR